MTDEEFKQTLWGVATELRRLVLVEKYKHPVFGLVFPAYVSDMFDVQAKAICPRIDGISCHADEACFGSIVAEVMPVTGSGLLPDDG